MKKKRGKIRSSRAKFKNNKLQNKKNLFSSYSFWILVAILLFLVSVIVITIINSPQPRLQPNPTSSTSNVIDLKDLLGSFGGDFFKVWVAGEGFNNESIAKVFLLVLIWLILILVFDGMFAGQRLFIINAIAFIVALFATAYITPEEFFGILQSYSALGLTLASLIPFAVLLMLTYRAAEASNGKVQLMMLSWFGWIFFTSYSVYKLLFFLADNNWRIESGSFVVLAILAIVTLLAGFMMIFNNKVTKQLTKYIIRAEGDAAEATVTRAIKGAKALGRAEKGLATMRGTGEGI